LQAAKRLLQIAEEKAVGSPKWTNLELFSEAFVANVPQVMPPRTIDR
jgi:hypothetical protein